MRLTQITKVIISLLVIFLVAGCANRYGDFQRKMDACGYGVAKYSTFHSCVKENIKVSSKNADNYYDQTAVEMLAVVDAQQQKINKKKISTRKAYENIADYCNQKSLEEQRSNQVAQAVGVGLLVGIAAVECANSNCMGGGGGRGYYNTPLLCSQNPQGHPKCSLGKACGNTCIAVSDTCHVGAGTACNMSPKPYP